MIVARFIFLLFQVLSCFTVGEKNEDHHEDEEGVEERLEHALFPHGENNHRPVKDLDDPIVVQLGLALRQIVEVNDVSQVLKTNVWMRIYWKTELLKWNPANFSGIRKINIWPTKIWKPDLVLYDSADDTRSANLEKQLDTRVTVDYEGNIRWLAPYIFRSQCKINIRYFPFDSQECKMEFGSWTYDGTMVDIQLTPNSAADLKNYISNGEWVLTDLLAVHRVEYYSCCPEPWPTVVYTLKLQRRTLYYIYNLILPCVLITLLSFLSFWLPPGSGERVGLVMTVLLSMAVFLLLVAESIPSTSEDVPLIGHFFIAIMFEVGLSLVCTCFLLQIHHNADRKPMSQRARKLIFGVFAKLVFFKSSHIKSLFTVVPKKEIRETGTVQLRQHNTSTKQTGHSGGATDIIRNDMADDITITATSSTDDVQKKGNMTVEGKEMLQYLRVLSESVAVKERESNRISEWREAGEVLDRLFFLLFLLVLIITCGIMFSMAPSFLT